MTQEQLQQLLSQCYWQEISADDAFDAIWGEAFAGETVTAPRKDLLASSKPSFISADNSDNLMLSRAEMEYERDFNTPIFPRISR